MGSRSGTMGSSLRKITDPDPNGPGEASLGKNNLTRANELDEEFSDGVFGGSMA